MKMVSSKVFCFVLFASASQAQVVSNYSGTWRELAGSTEILDRQDRVPGGWGNFLAGLRQSGDYEVTIQQTQREVAVRFPGRTFLNGPPYRPDVPESIEVQDIGQYWRKTITTVHSTDGVLTLGNRTLVGWWRDSRPEEVQRQGTELSVIHTLRLQQGGIELSIVTTVADEKGSASYRRVLSRVSP
jgi:hypothetical protein